MIGNRPVIAAAVSWIIGFVVASQVHFIWPKQLALILLVSFAVVWIWKVPGRLWVGCLVLIGIAAVYYQWIDERNLSGVAIPEMIHVSNSDVVAHVSGIIVSTVNVDGDRVSLTIHAERMVLNDERVIDLNERMQVSIRLLKEEEQQIAGAWRRGDSIRIAEGTLQEPSSARNFGGFDYKRYLYLKRIHWLITAKGTDHIDTIITEGSWNANHVLNRILRWNDALREAAGGVLDEYYHGIQSGYMKGLLIGQRDDLEPELFQQFAQLGLTHILAISGLHIGIFAAGCMLVLKGLRMTREARLVTMIFLLPLYVVFTGASPSAIRAGLMGMIAFYAAYKRILKDGLNLVCIVGVLMLLWNPYYLYDIGFQLSFIVTIGLIIFVPRVSRLLPISSKAINSSISITIVAELISFPISIYYFNQYSLISWLANLLIIPIVSMLVIPLGSLSLLLGSVLSQVGAVPAYVAIYLNRLVHWLVEHLVEWKMFLLIWPSPPVIWILCYFVGLLWVSRELIRWFDSKKRQDTTPSGPHANHSSDLSKIRNEPIATYSVDQVENRSIKPFRSVNILIAATFCFAILFYGYAPDRWDKQGRVHIIDVGQGDAILIRTPHKKYILVDGGGTVTYRKPGEEWRERRDPYEVGRKLLVPLLKKHGVQAIDYLLLTHADADHYGGLQEVLEQIPIRRFLFNGAYKPNPATRTLFETALRKEIPLQLAHSRRSIQVDASTHIQFLAPFEEEVNGVAVEEKQNNSSLVFLLTMYDSRFLFTGDMEKEAEYKVLARLQTAASVTSADPGSVEIDVLKVAHHGSKTSTTEYWLDYWNPRVAAISAGVNNPYRHPHPDVVSRLNEHGVQVYRTDVHGEVVFLVDNLGVRQVTKLDEFTSNGN